MENFGDYICADSPGDTVQFLEWSPTLCPRALLIGNSGGRVTIWTQPSQVSQLGTSFLLSLDCIVLVFGAKTPDQQLHCKTKKTSSRDVFMKQGGMQGGRNVGRSCNGWSCEHEWRQDQSVMTKWVPVMSPVFSHYLPYVGMSRPSSVLVC
jgi:hypothetical protein